MDWDEMMGSGNRQKSAKFIAIDILKSGKNGEQKDKVSHGVSLKG